MRAERPHSSRPSYPPKARTSYLAQTAIVGRPRLTCLIMSTNELCQIFLDWRWMTFRQKGIEVLINSSGIPAAHKRFHYDHIQYITKTKAVHICYFCRYKYSSAYQEWPEINKKKDQHSLRTFTFPLRLQQYLRRLLHVSCYHTPVSIRQLTQIFPATYTHFSFVNINSSFAHNFVFIRNIAPIFSPFLIAIHPIYNRKRMIWLSRS